MLTFLIMHLMTINCPECKNSVDMSAYPDLAHGSIIECNHCGITLEAKESDGGFNAEVVDEGK